VTKDNLLFTLFGLMLGFVTAWFMFERVSQRQPPRLTPDQAAAVAAGQPAPGASAGDSAAAAPPPGAALSGPGAPGASGPAMAEIQELKRHVEQNPNDAVAVLALANSNFDIRNWERARDLYLHYLTLREPTPDILSDLGVTYRALGQFEAALETFQQGEALAPDHWQSRFNQAVVLAFDLKQFDKAQAILDQLRKSQPDNPDVQRLAEEVAKVRNAA
jgi:Flp pilus assembly protein TadD